jgi:hypothetical protein
VILKIVGDLLQNDHNGLGLTGTWLVDSRQGLICAVDLATDGSELRVAVDSLETGDALWLAHRRLSISSSGSRIEARLGSTRRG